MPSHAAAGALAQELGQLPGAVMLALAFAALAQRRMAALIDVYAWQALAVAAAAAWQGWLRDSADLFVVAAIALGGKAIVLPLALRRITRQPAQAAVGLGVFPAAALGAGLVALAILVAPSGSAPAAGETAAPTREALALALAAMLLGLLLAATRRGAASRVIGVLAAENGVALGAIAAVGLPFLPVLSLAVLGLLGALVFGLAQECRRGAAR